MVTMPHWPNPFTRSFIDLKLNRIKTILERFDNPQNKLPPVIHVAGTNGKGSTIAFLRYIFNSAGYKVHQYTSPHLLRFNERIVISNKEISDKQIFEVMEECRLRSQDLNLTFYEATTVAAFLVFSRYAADVVLLETGLGGRLDATNLVTSPLMSIITTISFDHMEFLGDSLLDIAKEKAGIIKENSQCVISWQEEKIRNYFKDTCNKLNNKSYICNEDWNFHKNETGFSFLNFSDNSSINFPLPKLIGIHQILNASTAIAAIKQLDTSYTISDANIEEGLLKTYWPARMEKITKGVLYSLLPNGSELLIDGAHNTMAAQMIAATIDTLPKMKTILINGRTRQRDIKGFLLPFRNKIEHLFAVPVEFEPESENPQKIEDEAVKLKIPVTSCASITEAIHKCINIFPNQKFRIIICGSLYLMGDVLNANKI
ncbi:MAG: dihydrofolate synthase/folylpolyglutamate synthase [Candidatus Midichloriaceae bacterium]|jgi:dihydrofolate synthase/folylpolyglutamate synthase